jgi:hypothetical protein
MKTRKQKGRGFFKDVLNFFSGRKTARRKALQKQTLSNENEAKKKKLEKKWFKTKSEKEELKRLQAKLGKTVSNAYKQKVASLEYQANVLGIPRAKEQLQEELQRVEPGYEEVREKALDERYRIQKFFNRFYKDKPKVTAKIIDSPIEGIVVSKKNERFPLSKQNLKKPNSEIPTPPLKPQDQKTIDGVTLPTASQKDIEYMITPIFFAEWRQKRNLRTGELIIPKSLEDIPDREYERFVQAIQETEDLSIEEQVKALFQGRTVKQMDDLVKEEERGAISGRTKIFLSRNKQPNGTVFYTRKFGDTGAGGIGRLLSHMRQGKTKILETKEQDISRCVKDPSNSGRYAPLTTLKSNSCIFVGKGIEYFNEMRVGDNPSMLFNNWIILSPEYFPLARDQFLVMVAKFFPTEWYIQNALDNWGIEGIDLAFLELFQAKYPEFAIKISTFLVNTKDYPYQKAKLKPYENFLIVDKSIYEEEIGFTTLYPFSEPSKFSPMLQQAIQQKKLYGMSPYMAYILKKKSLPLWNQCFEAEGNPNSSVYTTLSAYEKIVVDYLQYLRFVEKLEDTNFNFAEARDTYKDFLGDGTPWNGLMKEIIELYREDFETHRKEIQFYQSLVKRQLARGDDSTILQTPDQIVFVLSKFKPGGSNGVNTNVNNNNSSRRSRRTQFEPTEENRRSFAPLRTVRRTFAPVQTQTQTQRQRQRTALGAFNRASLTAQRTNVETRRNALRSLDQINKTLASLEPRYSNIVKRYGSLEQMKPKLEFIRRKMQYLQGTRKQLNERNQAFLEEYMVAKTYNEAKKQGQTYKNTLRRLGYPVLPGSTSTMGETNTNNE